MYYILYPNHVQSRGVHVIYSKFLVSHQMANVRGENEQCFKLIKQTMCALKITMHTYMQ